MNSNQDSVLAGEARAGLVKKFTGITAPYEPPLEPELELQTDTLSIEECAWLLIQKVTASLAGVPAR